MIYPLLRSFLHPIFAWLNALPTRQIKQKWETVKARPTKTVHLAAQTLAGTLKYPPPPIRNHSAMNTLRAATDAGARQAHGRHQAAVRGWYTLGPASNHLAHWFHLELSPEAHPWACKRRRSTTPIAAIKLYGTLLLYRHILATHPQACVNLRMTLLTDNRGNSYQVTNHKSKNQVAAAMLMGLSLLKHYSRSPVTLTHTHRELNEGADQLTHLDNAGFCPTLLFHPSQDEWHILHSLIPEIKSTEPDSASSGD